MRPRLQQAIENLYTVFGNYPGNPKMAGSPVYGHLHEWNRDLFSKPLKDLDGEDLSRFTGKSMTTWGEVEDYKHFLPRIFELTAIYKTPYEIWIAFDKLKYGNWQDWDIKEQEVIHEYMVALFEHLLHDESGAAEWNFVDYFTSIINFYPDLQLLLQMWDATNTIASVKHLATFITNQAEAIFDKGKVMGFEDSEKHAGALKKWLLRPELKIKMEQAFFRYEKEEFAEMLSLAEQVLGAQLKLIPERD